MVEEKFFNFTEVSKEEFEYFKTEGFVTSDKYTVAKYIYIVLFTVFMIFAAVSFVYFYKLRKSYIIRQRGFMLTFLGGIVAFLNVAFSLSSQIFQIPCSLNVVLANSLSVLLHSFFVVRSLRIILFYYLNLFKVSSINKKRLNTMKMDFTQQIEPNRYIMKVYRKINIINCCVLIIPTLISSIITVIMYISKEELRDACPLFKPTDPVKQIKDPRVQQLLIVILICSSVMMVLNIVNAITLCFIKDSSKYGIRFECIIVSVLIVLINSIGIVFRNQAGNQDGKYPLRAILNIYNVTKGGEMMYSFISFYIFLVFIPIPIRHYYKAKNLKNRYFQDPMSSLHFFYKVLNTPSLVNELRNIAVKEFSVENVLFWENYKVLQEKSKNYQLYYSRDYPSIRPDHQCNFDYYYYQLQQRNYAPDFLNRGGAYNPNLPIPKELFSYYISFYHMFIDYNGPSVVNLPEKTVKGIVNEMCSYPTVGIYDQAAREVIEMMYTSLYPILLNQNKEYIMSTVI